MAYQPRPEFIVVNDAGMPLPQPAELIAYLSREYGSEYLLVLAGAIESASCHDQASYMASRDTAKGVLAQAGCDRSMAGALVVKHVEQFLAAIRADHQNSGHHDVAPNFPPQKGP